MGDDLSVGALLIAIGLVLALLEGIRTRGESLLVWAVVFVAIGLLVRA